MSRQTPQQRAATDRFSQKFWADRLYHRTWEKDGKMVESNSYYVRIKHDLKRRDINLCTADRGEAARRAFYFFKVLMAQGWEAAEATLRAPGEKPKAKSCTIGEYIAAARSHFQGLATTFEDYCRNLRLIVAEALNVTPVGMEDRAFEKAEALAWDELRQAQAEGRKDVPPRFHLRDKSKEEKAWVNRKAGNLHEEALSRLRYDYAGKGNEAWTQAVDRLPLSKITPALVNKWATARIKAAEAKNPQARKSARTSVETVQRQARSLFSRKVLGFVRAELSNLPEVLPFDGLKIERAKVKKFRVVVGWADLMAAAEQELATDREALKAFCLAAGGGLRKREMDALTWNNVNTKTNQLTVAVSEHYGLKSEDSEREIPLQPEVMSFLAQCQQQDKAKAGDFVIKGELSTCKRSRVYRCEKAFSRLIQWLRAQGVTDRKPIHYLRKLAGETLAQQAGVYAASSYLGHSSVKVTQEYYASGRPTIAPSLTQAMGGKVIAFPAQEPEETKGKRRAGK
jgi:integrase